MLIFNDNIQRRLHTYINKFSFQWITQQEGLCEDGWFKSELIYLKQL